MTRNVVVAGVVVFTRNFGKCGISGKQIKKELKAAGIYLILYIQTGKLHNREIGLLYQFDSPCINEYLVVGNVLTIEVGRVVEGAE